jgi:tetratricopeptide (TPR) repeat protein
MDIARRCEYISNSFYNRGLKLAAERNLCGAVLCLKKSLEFNKSNVDARNLLGLIFYEYGEVADALAQWVISTNIFNSKTNLAARYLEDIRADEKRLDSYDDAIIRYNQALTLAQGGSGDLAAIQLTKLVEEHPRYVKAQLLLGVICMSAGDYRKAIKAFGEVLAVDTGNVDALRFSYDAKKQLAARPRKDVEQEKREEETKAILAEPEAVIIPTYREHSWINAALYIFMGLLIGSAAVYFLYIPVHTSNQAESHNAQLIEVNEKLNSANNTIDTLESQIEELSAQIDEYTMNSDSLDDQFTEKLSQYQKLMGVIQYLDNEDILSAARLYVTIDSYQITDVPDDTSISSKAIYNNVKSRMEGDVHTQLMALGDQYYSEDNWTRALIYYTASLQIKPKDPDAIYKSGMAHKQLGDRQAANELFTQIIKDYPDSSVADDAKAARGY